MNFSKDQRYIDFTSSIMTQKLDPKFATRLIGVTLMYAWTLMSLVMFCSCSQQNFRDEQHHHDVREAIIDEVNATNIREYLRILSKDPHVAGSVYDMGLADYIAATWLEQGLDSVQKVNYSTMLSFADESNPNKVHLLDDDGDIIFTSKHTEDMLREEDNHLHHVPIYNAFSPNATVEGDIVYCHYGRPNDFKQLENLGINITGKIVIARYGKIYRGNKVMLAQQHGAIGMILYSDPSEYAQNGVNASDVYPRSSWLPGTGVQRGSLNPVKGDITTQAYPSIDGVYRTALHDLSLPKIPCQPIGYEDANHILSLMEGQSYPADWEIPNAPSRHRIGPGFLKSQPIRKVRLATNNYLEMTNITNVIGTIRGSIEPDRYVLAGNHRDAWGFGAVDASSGTAQMLETTRVLGVLLRKGWRPRRTIVFCSWSGEEFGLIGSTEWVEEHLTKLSQRAVAYINTDVCVSGDKFNPGATPFLHQLLLDVSKEIPSPKNESSSLYDEWRSYDQAYAPNVHNNLHNFTEISINLPGGGTDHVPFAFFAGIPSIDLTFDVNEAYYDVPIHAYPAYHSAYDSFYLVDQYIDPGFHHHRACSHLNGLLLQKLADDVFLPFHLTHYSETIVKRFVDFQNTSKFHLFAENGVDTIYLEKEIRHFNECAHSWEERFNQLNTTDELTIRAWNDQISHLEQAFLIPGGLPTNKQYRHLVFSLSMHNYYGSNVFPGLQDLLHDIERHPEPDVQWDKIKHHVSHILVAFHRASDLLKPMHLI